MKRECLLAQHELRLARTHLLQQAVQGVLVRLCQPVFLQPQQQLSLPVGPQGQEVQHPVPEGPLCHTAGSTPSALSDGTCQVNGGGTFPGGYCISCPWRWLSKLNLLP